MAKTKPKISLKTDRSPTVDAVNISEIFNRGNKFKLKVQNLEKGSRYWVWGGATKGVLFLKHLADFCPDVFCKVVGVIDINEKKQGLFTPTTGVMISSPKDFFKLVAKNDTIIVMNPNYLNEIRKEIETIVNYSIKVIQF